MQTYETGRNRVHSGKQESLLAALDEYVRVGASGIGNNGKPVLRALRVTLLTTAADLCLELALRVQEQAEDAR